MQIASRRFVGFMVLSSIGTLLIVIVMSNTQAWSGALFYLVHSTLIAQHFTCSVLDDFTGAVIF
ncbi:hypothetical protein ABVN80_03485 [Acinetobacter baumannii]